MLQVSFSDRALFCPRSFAYAITSIANLLPPLRFYMAGSFSFFSSLFKHHVLKETSLTAMSTVGFLITAINPIPFLGTIFISFIVLVKFCDYLIIYLLDH